MTRKTYRIILISSLIIFSISILSIFLTIRNHSKRYFETTAKSSLTKVLDINELHTLEYRYNSYTVVYATKYSMETYDEYKEVLQAVNKEYSVAKKTLNQSFEEFRSRKILTLQEELQSASDSTNPVILPPEDESVLVFLDDLCVTNEDYDELNTFLSQPRKNAVKMISTVKYAVAYEGIITAGINKPIDFEIDKDSKTVTVVVPRAEIIDTNISIPADTENKSVIFSDKKYINNDDWHKEAFKACRYDLQEKLITDTEFLDLATENAKDAITALLRPFESQSTYKFLVTTIN